MEGMLTPADVAVLSGNTGNGNSGFGEGGAWWVIIFLIFALGGWGRNGNGFGGGNSGALDNYVLASDFASLQRQLYDGFNSTNRKLDATQEGICDATFALNNTINSGNFAIQNALCQGFSGINQNIVTNGYETRNAITDLGYGLQKCCCDLRTQIADCCCELGRGQERINYNMAMNTNALQQTLCNNTRDIIENANANYRAIHEELINNKLEMKNERIAEQQNEINALRLSASQAKQNAYLLNELKPCPSAAYIVPNPNCCYDYTVTRNTCCNNGIY